MLNTPVRIGGIALTALLLCSVSTCSSRGFLWNTVVNNGDLLPESTRTFNSYSQPAVNERGLVVFRGRSVGPQQPERGIYQRDTNVDGPIVAVTRTGDTVPQPNNTLYNGELARFNEFPSIPRIDALSDTVATRGQSQPVWTYLLPDATETRVGTAGIYANPVGTLLTGVGLLGAVRDAATNELVFPEFQVPGAPEGTRFDQFPGSVAVTGGSIVVFKGNFTEAGEGRTGVFYRDTLADAGGAPVELIARAGDPIPEFAGAVFDSTAPPSAAAGHAFFVGSDNEDAPTAGGVYRAPLEPSPALETLVAIGSPVPGEVNETFAKFGEGLSVSSNGRHVSFWGAWGTETRPIVLLCATDGNADLLAYCNEQYPEGFETTVPVHQGIFVYDTVRSELTAVAKTGEDDIDEFLYWVFSGRPPGVGGGGGGEEEPEEEEAEPPRWRSSAFASVTTFAGPNFRVAFKARRGVDGIHFRGGVGRALQPLVTAVAVGDPGTDLDVEAPVGSVITTVGIEREGLRKSRLAISASMLLEAETEEESVGWAGVYLTRLPAARNR